MSVRTVRLDDDSERLLSQIHQITGMSVSVAFKEGLKALHKNLAKSRSNSPYAIYQQLDLGPGGYGVGPSSDVSEAVKEVIRRKIRR